MALPQPELDALKKSIIFFLIFNLFIYYLIKKVFSLAERIEDVNLEKQAREDLQQYAVYVALHRAIPRRYGNLFCRIHN